MITTLEREGAGHCAGWLLMCSRFVILRLPLGAGGGRQSRSLIVAFSGDLFIVFFQLDNIVFGIQVTQISLTVTSNQFPYEIIVP